MEETEPRRPAIAIMGVGAMGGALLGGLLNSEWEAADITLIEARPPRADELREATGCRTVHHPAEGIDQQPVVVLAVKPQHIDPALEQLAGAVTPQSLLIALVAGVRIARYEAALPGVPVIRAMPNTPALAGEGVTGLSPGSRTGPAEVRLARAVLSAVGKAAELPEPLLDAVTALSGSGPAYVYRLAEALAEAGEEAGMDPDVALMIARYEAALPGVPVIRAMPNTPALAGEGVTGLSPGSRTGPAEVRLARAVLSAVGKAAELPEPLLDAVTALSGSGPAYVYRLAEALAEAGEEAGMDPDVALMMARQTVKGAGALLDSSSEHPAELRRQVTSPQGVTEAALAVLEEGGFVELLKRAVAAGTERSRRLGD